MALTTSLLVVLAWVSFPVPAAADPVLIFVDADASGGNDGTSWADAYNYLQDALVIAQAGDEVWVAEGTYRPDEGAAQTAGDREASFQLIDGVAIYGGFAGGEISRDERDWQTNQTILSGDIGMIDDNTDNIYHVVSGDGIVATAILDGFTITAGNADGSLIDYGGGMLNTNSSPTLSNCIFSGNGAWSGGGGMYNTNTSNPTLTDCAFSENWANGSGGGIYNEYSSPTLDNCTFSGNGAAMGPGGGMYNNSDSSPTLTNCSFSGNYGDDGGGMFNSGSLTLINCSFSGNSSFSYGGGMCNFGSSTLANCTFSGNEAGYGGGGLYNYSSSPTMTNCTFSGNVTWSVGDSNGGGLYSSGGSPMLTNCTFSGNVADSGGGGMFNSNSNPILTECTFSGNEAYEYGSGMYNNSSSPTLTGCTFSNNSSEFGSGGGMYNGESSGPTLVDCIFSDNSVDDGDGGGMFNANSSPILTNCTFTGNYAAFGGGMSNSYSSPTLTNCSFIGNMATYDGGGMLNLGMSSPMLTNCTFSGNVAALNGGGMYNSSSSPTLTNCVLWGNSDNGENDESAQIHNDIDGTPVLNYCCLQGWTGALGGTGNIGDDPLFVDADGPDGIAGNADDNLRLLADSPCIDTGDNSAVPAGVTTDLDGAPRISDGDHDGNAVVDMGAYEGNFVQVTYDLTMEVDGSGSTTPAVGTYTHNEGDIVDINATPDPGWEFVNWTGDVATMADVNADITTVTMNGDYNITANFAEIAEVTYDLTMAVNGSGTTSPSAGSHTYNEGTELYITATPGSGWQFVNWTGSVADINAASTIVVVDADKTVTANFTRIPHDLTMTKNGSGSTTPAAGVHTYNEGDVVDIIATAAAGWEFDSWTGDVAMMADVNAATTTVTMNGDYTITAIFTQITHNLTVAIEGSGSTTPAAGVHTCSEGLVVPITATPDSGWHFVHWTDDVTDPNSSNTTVVMDSDKTITAYFAIDTFTLIYTAGSGGTLTGQASQTVSYDEDGTAVEAVASTGYSFVDWSDGSTDNPRTDMNVTSDISVTANFARTIQITYDLTMAVSGNGTVDPAVGVHTYNEGTGLTVIATPDSGWEFVNWTGDVADPSSASTTVTINDNKTVTANFTEIESNILAQQTISPESPATVNSDDDQIVIQFPANSVGEEAVVTIKKESQDSIPSCPSGFKAGATYFSIEMTGDLAPGKTVNITVKYSNADLEASEGDPDKLTLSRYDEDTEEWIMLPTTADTEAMTLTAGTDQFSKWMIMASEALAGEASDEGGTALWIWLVSIFGGLAVLIAIVSAIVINKRKSSLWHRVYSRH